MEVDGEVTKSVLTWHVRREDSGRQLSCRVSNPWFPAHTLEDSVTLDVMCEFINFSEITRMHKLFESKSKVCCNIRGIRCKRKKYPSFSAIVGNIAENNGICSCKLNLIYNVIS